MSNSHGPMLAHAEPQSPVYEAMLLLMELECAARKMHDCITERGANVRMAISAARVGPYRITVQYDAEHPTHYVYFHEAAEASYTLRGLFSDREAAVRFIAEKGDL